jgi:hypothetical protein
MANTFLMQVSAHHAHYCICTILCVLLLGVLLLFLKSAGLENNTVLTCIVVQFFAVVI